MTYKPEYGEKIKITKQYKRRTKSTLKPIDHIGHNIETKTEKYWNSVDFNSNAIYLGKRTLSNGVRDYDNEFGYYFIPKNYFIAAVVSPGPHNNNIYVPLDAIHKGL